MTRINPLSCKFLPVPKSVTQIKDSIMNSLYCLCVNLLLTILKLSDIEANSCTGDEFEGWQLENYVILVYEYKLSQTTENLPKSQNFLPKKLSTDRVIGARIIAHETCY